jgi:hypothetical protein
LLLLFVGALTFGGNYMKLNELRTATKNEVLQFIRNTLTVNGVRFRFEMSGYESTTGACTLLNLSIISRFAYLGIYDYSHVLWLDFYKGTPSLYMYDYNGALICHKTFSGYTTSEIIYEVFKETIFSNKTKRRRS